MTTELNALNPQGLTQLRARLNQGDADAAREVAKQFESLFVQQMLKSMRAATPQSEGGVFGGQQEQQYLELFDRQLSMSVSQGQGLGLAPMIERQLRANMGLPEEQPPQLNRSLDGYTPRPSLAAKAVEAPAVGDKGPLWQSAQEFVQEVWEAADRTAKRLGVPTKALVAQAALETGWGQHVIRRGDGGSSNNLFNIKAHNSWQGDSVKVPTLEYRDGVAAKELASFRAYRSLEESFDDYANFLEQNPRYRRALEAGDDPERYVEELQRAGYATDPAYADKIKRIMGGELLSSAELKNFTDRSTT